MAVLAGSAARGVQACDAVAYPGGVCGAGLGVAFCSASWLCPLGYDAIRLLLDAGIALRREAALVIIGLIIGVVRLPAVVLVLEIAAVAIAPIRRSSCSRQRS